MTSKEQAYSIIDGFTEKQLKGFVDLFAKPEPDDECRETDRILEKLARTFLGSFDDPQLEKETQELIRNLSAGGHTGMRAYLYAYNFMIRKYIGYFRITMTLLSKGYSILQIAEFANKPVKEMESMVELLREKNLIE